MTTAPTPKRERFWGLYDLDAREWLTESGDGQISSINRWSNRQPTAKKVRFVSATVAKKTWSEYDPDCVTAVVPRPFYVVRRPRKLPAEVHALVEVVRDWRDGHASWTEIADALKKYEESC